MSLPVVNINISYEDEKGAFSPFPTLQEVLYRTRKNKGLSIEVQGSGERLGQRLCQYRHW